MLASLRRITRWLLQENEDLRGAPRLNAPEILVHYWDGSATGGRAVRDISEHGAYICTREHWYPGTVIRIIIETQRMTVRDNGPRTADHSICVACRVVRHAEDGVAVEFVFRDRKERENLQKFLAAIQDQTNQDQTNRDQTNQDQANRDQTADDASRARSPRRGQALVEFALITPLVFLLAVNAINFGGYLFAWITVANAARAGAQYMVMSGITSPTSAQVKSLVTSDVTSLLNRSSIVVATCTNSTTSSNGCTTLHDPEAPAYTLATVDVTYTYKPFIPLFSFPTMGVSATLPPTAIHRKAVMRMMQ